MEGKRGKLVVISSPPILVINNFGATATVFELSDIRLIALGKTQRQEREWEGYESWEKKERKEG